LVKILLRKLNDVNVNGAWKHGRVNQDDEENPDNEDQTIPDDHLEHFPPDPLVNHDGHMPSQI